MELTEILPIIYRIRLLSKMNTTYIDAELKDYDVFYGDFQFLYLIYANENLTQREISKKLNFHESSVTRGIKRLEKKEFIKRVKSNEDKRRYVLSITPKGLEMLKLNFSKQKEFESNIKKLFADEELENLEEYLERIIKNLN